MIVHAQCPAVVNGCNLSTGLPFFFVTPATAFTGQFSAAVVAGAVAVAAVVAFGRPYYWPDWTWFRYF